MYNVEYSGSFNSDCKRIAKRGYNFAELRAVMEMLVNGVALSPKHRDHALMGNYIGYRDCHIRPDWVLIYCYVAETNTILFHRTGSHSDLFR